MPWPHGDDFDHYKPQWKAAGQTNVGDTIYVQFNTPAQSDDDNQSASVECGDSITVQVHVAAND